MAKPIIDHEVWALIEPLMPPARPRRFRYPGRKPVADRAALTRTLFVLKSGFAGANYPPRWAADRASVAGVACATGNRLAFGTDCTRSCSRSCALPIGSTSLASSSIRLLFERLRRAKNWTEPHRSCATRFQTSRRYRRQRHAARDHPDGRNPQRRHATASSGGRHSTVSLRAWSTAAQAGPNLCGSSLRPRQISPAVARCQDSHIDCPTRRTHGSGRGKIRWVVECTNAWLHGFRRLCTRVERRADIHEGFLNFA